MCCTLNKHFGVLIGETGFHRVSTAVELVHGCASFYNGIEDEEFAKLWCSPEQLRRFELGYTTAANVYSLGVILYEIATRRLPFKAIRNDPKNTAGNSYLFLKIADLLESSEPHCYLKRLDHFGDPKIQAD